MGHVMERSTARVVANPACDRSGAHPGWATFLGDLDAAFAAVRTWDAYAPTPLRIHVNAARELGLAQLLVKDESSRFGLGSFKATGGPLGVREAVARGAHRVVCASAGNHGKAVAWGARALGVPAMVYLSRAVSPARADAIAALGAEVVVAGETYDEAVTAAYAAAANGAGTFVSDTAAFGDVDIPRAIQGGYATVLFEALAQAAEVGAAPTHVVVPAGVGGLAAAAAATLATRFGAARPRLVVVEPEQAACCLASAMLGRRTIVSGRLDTAMGCLACAEPCPLAWEVVRPGADWFVAIGDDALPPAMALLAAGEGEVPPVHAGPSGAATLAALLALDAEQRVMLELDRDASVLALMTEGAPAPTGAMVIGS